MRSPIRFIAFTLLAPVTVPAYIGFLAFANLLGGAFYIVIEATLSPMLGRPVSLSRTQMVLLTVPVLAAAPFAMTAHLVVWLVLLAGRFIVCTGRWQTALQSRMATFLTGVAWITVAVWTTVTCLNAAVGTAWIGMPIQGRDVFVEFSQRPRTLGQLPPEMQRRRRAILEQVQAQREAVHPRWEVIRDVLQDDDFGFRWMRSDPLRRKLTGMPWYFDPAELSRDGQDHSIMLMGPLLFVWLVLVRWPGTFWLFRWPPVRVAWLLARLGLVGWSVFYLITWEPITDYYGFIFEDGAPTPAFKLLSPALLLGMDYEFWVRPEWYLFNAGLWIAAVLFLALLWHIGWAAAPFLGWPRYYVAFLAARLLQRKRIAFFSVGAVTLCVAMMIIVNSVMGGFVDSIRARANGLLGDLILDGGLQGFPFYQEFINQVSALKDKEGEPIIEQATPLIHSYGILQFPGTKKTKAVRVWGIRLDEYARVNDFETDLFYQQHYGATTLDRVKQPYYAFDSAGIARLPEDLERYRQKYRDGLSEQEQAEFDKRYHRSVGDFYPGPGVFAGPGDQPEYQGAEYPGIIIGRSILFQRRPSGDFRRGEDYPRGELCLLTIMPVTRGGDISAEPPLKPAFRYVDDSRTGIHEIDSMNVYVDFEELQKLLAMDPLPRAEEDGLTAARCSQMQIKLKPKHASDRNRLMAARDRVMAEWDEFADKQPADGLEYQMMRNVGVNTWEEMQRDYIAAIEKEKFLVLIMFGVISIVAVFLILCIFYMIVQEKIRDIGIMKSVGAGTAGVVAVFLAYGGGIGLVGCLLGSLLGTTFVEHINDIQDWLARLNPDWRVWSPETYSFDKIPDVWKWADVLWICVLAVIASIVGATFPALRAGRTWPVESLRYE